MAGAVEDTIQAIDLATEIPETDPTEETSIAQIGDTEMIEFVNTPPVAPEVETTIGEGHLAKTDTVEGHHPIVPKEDMTVQEREVEIPDLQPEGIEETTEVPEEEIPVAPQERIAHQITVITAAEAHSALHTIEEEETIVARQGGIPPVEEIEGRIADLTLMTQETMIEE